MRCVRRPKEVAPLLNSKLLRGRHPVWFNLIATVTMSRLAHSMSSYMPLEWRVRRSREGGREGRKKTALLRNNALTQRNGSAMDPIPSIPKGPGRELPINGRGLPRVFLSHIQLTSVTPSSYTWRRVPNLQNWLASGDPRVLTCFYCFYINYILRWTVGKPQNPFPAAL